MIAVIAVALVAGFAVAAVLSALGVPLWATLICCFLVGLVIGRAA